MKGSRRSLTIVPASQLGPHAPWQELADQLPEHCVLFVVPTVETPLKTRMRTVARAMQARGYQVVSSSIDFRNAHGSA
jgi:hypothetical protein